MPDNQDPYCVLNVRIPRCWQPWLSGFRQADRSSTNSQLVERALRSYADSLEYEQPPSDHLNYGKRGPYKNYYMYVCQCTPLEKCKDSGIIGGKSYSCTSRNSTTGEFMSGRRPKCQMALENWYPILDGIPKDRKFFTLAANSS